MMLDIKTLMMLYLIINVISTGAMAVIWSQHRGRFAGITLWLVDMILQVAGSLLLILRGLIPDLISMTGSNTLILAGALILFIGLERFTGKKGWQIHNYVLLAIFMAVSAYFVLVQPDLTVREIALSVMTVIFTFQCCWLLLRRVPPGMRQATRLTGIVFAGYVALNSVRIILTIITPEQTNDFFKSGAVSALAVTGYIVLSTCLTISLVLMVNRRLLADVKTQEEKFTTAFHSSPYAIMLTRPSDGIIFEVNDGFVNISGHEYSEAVGKTTIDLNLWVNEEERLAVVSELTQGREIRGVEYQFRHKTGRVITGLFSANLVTVDNEKYILSSIGDITERKQAEEAVRIAEDTYRNVFLNSQIGLFRTDIQTGMLLDANDATARFVGYKDRAELLAGPFSIAERYADPHDREKMISLLQAHSEFQNFEAPFRRNDGTIILMRFSARLIKQKGWIEGVSEDITERKKVEYALRDSEAKYRRIVETANEGIISLDRDTRITFVNQQMASSLGYTLEEMLGQKFELFLAEDQLSDHYEQMKNRAQGEDAVYERCFTRKDGGRFWALISAKAIIDSEGRWEGALGMLTDITERKQAEEALKESEAQYRLLSEHMTDVVWLMDMNFNTLYNSPSVEKLRGFTLKEIKEMPAEKNLTPTSLKIAYEVFLEELAKIQADPCYKLERTLEVEMYRKNGTTFWAETKFSLIRDENNKAVSILCEARDITERRKAYEALNRIEAQYRLLADHMTDTVWLMDMQLKTTYQSPSAEKLRGYKPEEILGMQPEKHVTPESLKLVFEVLSEEIPRVEADPGYNPVRTVDLEYYHKDGTTVWAESKFSVIRDGSGKPVSILAEARDITERKRAEEALQDSEEKYRLLVDNAMEAIFVDAGGMFKFANSQATILTGYSQEELTSRPYTEFIHPDDRQLVAERGDRRITGLEVPGPYTFRAIVKSGDTKWVELSAVPITWEGKPAVLSFLTDVTDRKRLEEEQQRVAKLEAVGLLAGGIAHDFNNILTSILGNISLAGMEAAPGSELKNSLEQAEKASLRAKALTVQLLTFSKGGAPVLKLASLTELLKDTAGFALSGSRVKCNFSLPANLWHAEIDAGQVSQVIHNLVINAQQSMPTGGSIEISAENIALSEMQSLGKGLPLKSGDYIRIAVADHGTGIPGDHLEKIFDPFFTTKQKGNGMGLAISFSIARQHGGHLSVESELGTGSTFYLYLPASVQTSAPKEDKKEAIKPAGKARILVMDDEKGVREIAGRLLKHIGYKDVEFAGNGAEAIKLYKAAMKSGNPFTVAILDLTIAGGMGGEVAIQKLLKIDPGLKAIVSSGYIDDPVMAKHRDHGFSGMVAKPYTIEELRKAVQDVIG